MRRIFLSIAALFATAFLLSTMATAADNTAAILERQTQEIMDAITYGKAEVWERYMDPNALYTDESGNIITKSQMVNDTKPLPAGVSGNIKVTEFKAVVQGSTAIATHLDDEHENYHGHELHCQYRTTDTWIKTPQGWRLLGSQILAVRTDPPSIQLTPQQMDEYVGRYALTPDIVYEIRKKDGALEGQQTGRKPEPIRAEIADMLFVPDKVRYRKVFLRGAGGHITGFAERREAWDLVWKRLP
jgi:hypothetical protein